jgi:RNA polymerase sigma-70 factor (ECF subfamily)
VSSLDGLDSPTDVDANTESFERFAQHEFRPLIGLAYALCGDRAVAPELAQEALLAAFAQWETVRHLDKPEAWVRRVLVNRATSTVRRRIIEARALVRLRSRPDIVPMGEPSAETEWLWSHVRGLPRRQRQVVALHYVERLTLEEIAASLEISKASANTHLRRARATLSRRINKEDLQ